MAARRWLATTLTLLVLAACASPAPKEAGPTAGASAPQDTSATAGGPAMPGHDGMLGTNDASAPEPPGAGGNGPVAGEDGAADMPDGALADAPDASEASDAQTDGQVPTEPGFAVGVNVHNYPKPTAYGFVAADGADRMGDALVQLSVRYVRGPTIGDVDFLARLSSFGVTHVILGLDAKSYGKPFSADALEAALALSMAEVTRLGLHAVVEGLNEWDLFNTRTYNEGVLPAGVDSSQFIALTQRALYEAAHPLGIPVLGPSVGHPRDQANLDFFPDVAAYVDLVNVHLYFGTDPESLPIAEVVASHEAFQGAGKPLWVTETGVSAYGGVTEAQQADVIARGLAYYAASGQIDAAFIYQLIDQSEPGWSGSTFTPDGGEYHFGLFDFDGVGKPGAGAVQTAIDTL